MRPPLAITPALRLITSSTSSTGRIEISSAVILWAVPVCVLSIIFLLPVISTAPIVVTISCCNLKWILAVRPKTLGASVVPIAVGSAAARIEGEFQPAIAFARLAAALLLQVAANLINDAIDFLKGIDTEIRRGPRRVTQHGLIPAPTVLRAAGLATALAACVGAYLVWSGGLPILVWRSTVTVAGKIY